MTETEIERLNASKIRGARNIADIAAICAEADELRSLCRSMLAFFRVNMRGGPGDRFSAKEWVQIQHEVDRREDRLGKAREAIDGRALGARAVAGFSLTPCAEGFDVSWQQMFGAEKRRLGVTGATECEAVAKAVEAIDG